MAYLVLDFEKICRLCLQETGVMSHIFERNEDIQLKDLILCATGLQISEDDGLPTQVCHKCRYVIELSCEMQDKVMKSYQFLLAASETLHTLNTLEQLTVVMDCEKFDLIESEKNKEINKQNTNNNDFQQVKMECKTDQTNLVQEGSLGYVSEEDKKLQNNFNSVPCEIDNNKTAKLEQENKQNTEKENEFTDINIQCGTVQSNLLQDDSHGYVSEGAAESENNFSSFLATNKKKAPKYLTCQICLNPRTTVEQVKLHVDSHYKDTKLTPYLNLKCPYKCEECGESPLSKKQLVLHHRRHLNVNPYVCEFPGCEYIGKSYDTLRYHLIRHGDRRVVCAACGRSYRRMNELRQHEQRAHAHAPRVPCSVCRKTFRNRYTYANHLKIHTDKPKHRCEESSCSKWFRSASSLAAHALAHAQQRPHQCHTCGAAYTTLAVLNRHMRAHARADAQCRVRSDVAANIEAVSSGVASKPSRAALAVLCRKVRPNM